MKKHLLALLALATILPAFAGKLPYTYTRVGNAADLAVAGTVLKAGIVLMGGGTDVDAAFRWLGDRCGNGDILVIRATGTDAYNPYIRALCPQANSVATLIIPSVTAANDVRVQQFILQAEAIWIAGGDQSNYLNYWKGTRVQAALQQRISDRAPIGGTSAGMNVLTQYIYSAQENKGVTSSQALANPYTKYITLDRDFVVLPTLAGVIGDPHFATRDRMGRDLAFLALLYPAAAAVSKLPRGLSVDEETALLVDESTGTGTVVGNGSVYFLQAPGAPAVCQPDTPLTYTGIGVYRIDATGSFDLLRWSGRNGVSYQVSATAGVMSSTQPGGSLY